jgi:hypothetical protein
VRSVEARLQAAQRPPVHQAVPQRLEVRQVPEQAQQAPVQQAQRPPEAARGWLPAALPARALGRRPGPQRPAALRAPERVVWRAPVQRAEALPARSARVCLRI